MSLVAGNIGEKVQMPDGAQVDHLSENTVGHGVRVKGVSDPTTYPILTGDVGEELTASGSAVSLNTSTYVTIATLTLTPGVWDISSMVEVLGVTSLTTFASGIATASNSNTGWVFTENAFRTGAFGATSYAYGCTLPYRRSITTSTTYYLTGIAGGASTTANGKIRAIRIA